MTERGDESVSLGPPVGPSTPAPPPAATPPAPAPMFSPPTPDGRAPVAPSPRRSGSVIVGGITMLAGALLAIVGSLLPWLSFDGIGDVPNGFETYPLFGDGTDRPLLWTNPGAYVVAAYGVLALVSTIVLAAGKATWSSVCAIVVALAAGATSLAALVTIADVINNFRGLNVGPGIVMVGLAAVVSFVGALIVAIAR